MKENLALTQEMTQLTRQFKTLQDQLAAQQLLLSQQRAKIEWLEQSRSHPFPPSASYQPRQDEPECRFNKDNPHKKPARSSAGSGRRQLLRQLAAGLVGGVVVGGAASLAAVPDKAEAGLLYNPPGGNSQIGAFVNPPGVTRPSNNPPSSSFTTFPYTPVYGLVATDNTIFDLSTLPPSYTGLYTLATGEKSVGVYTYTRGYASRGLVAAAEGDHATSVSGFIGSSNTNSAAIYGDVASGATNCLAGSFVGDVTINGTTHVYGTFTATSKAFRIDHPLDPANRYLNHSVVEANEMKTFYDGMATLDEKGEALVQMPEWFEDLNRDFRYQLTAIGQAAPGLHISQEVKDRRFKIGGGTIGLKVCWQVSGIRQDEYAKAHPLLVEESKTEKERGRYLHPELYGQGRDKAVYQRMPQPTLPASDAVGPKSPRHPPP